MSPTDFFARRDGTKVPVTEILSGVPSGGRLYDALQSHQWKTKEDAEFVAIEMTKFVIDNLDFLEIQKKWNRP